MLLPDPSMRNTFQKSHKNYFFGFVQNNFCFSVQFSIDKFSFDEFGKLSKNLIVSDAQFGLAFSILPIVVIFWLF
jgi:hypothetical protein